MINVLILTILNCALIVGLYKSFQFEYNKDLKPDNDTKNCFWFYKYYILDRLPYRVAKPFGGCLVCMSSVFSFAPYWWFYCWDFSNFDLWLNYPLYVLILAGLNTIVDKFINE